MPKPTAPLDAQRVRTELAGSRFADVRYVAHTASTNADVQALLGDAGAYGTTVVAEYQSAGAGRKGRRWFAPPGAALLFTAILPGAIDAAALWAVPFWIALAVAQAVEQQCGVELDLVWPNDLHARGGKTGGILSVARIAGDAAWVGCGVGINVYRPAADTDLDALRPQPVFLDTLAPHVEREALLVTLLRTFDRSFEDLRDPGAVATHWEQRANLRGTVYRYVRDTGGRACDGVAQRLGPHGSLVVRGSDGETAIDMADVRVIGRAPAGAKSTP